MFAFENFYAGRIFRASAATLFSITNEVLQYVTFFRPATAYYKKNSIKSDFLKNLIFYGVMQMTGRGIVRQFLHSFPLSFFIVYDIMKLL